MNLSAAYLSDIERGNRNSPIEHLEQLAKIFAIEDDEMEFFYDLSGCIHKNWPELNEYLASCKGARMAIRWARDNGISEEEFLQAVLKMANESQAAEIEIEKQF